MQRRWTCEEIDEFRNLTSRLSNIVQLMAWSLMSQDPNKASEYAGMANDVIVLMDGLHYITGDSDNHL